MLDHGPLINKKQRQSERNSDTDTSYVEGFPTDSSDRTSVFYVIA